jgi:hypothetical protein
MAALIGDTKSGLQKIFWGFTRDMPQNQLLPPSSRSGGRFGRSQALDPGTYKVTLLVDDKEVGSHRPAIQSDPMFK